MSLIEQIILTTHIDRHYERHALSALEGLAGQVNTHYIPNGIEHDPRFPPVGRLLSAEIIELADGEKGVRAVIELFDESTVEGDPRRSVPMRLSDTDAFLVEYDRSVEAHDPDGDVEALARLSGSPAQRMHKKALEPLAELILDYGLLALGAIATGFLAKMGADGWNELKARLKERHRKRRHDELLVTRFGVEVPAPVEVLVVLSNPTADEIEAFYDHGLERADELVQYVLQRESRIVRIVFHWIDMELRLGYALRDDAIPVLVDPDLIPPLPDEWQEKMSDQDGDDELA
jgi:hypothetical protein